MSVDEALSLCSWGVAASRRIVRVEVGWDKVVGWSLKESLLGQRLWQLELVI
jgi:hypothetical protein